MLHGRSQVRKLYLMPFGRVVHTPPDGDAIDILFPCYLIEMKDGLRILVDTGLNHEDPVAADYPGMVEKKSVFEHLATLYLDPDDIDIVVCTHFDDDHAGYHDAFRDAEFLVQHEHYNFAKAGHPRTDPTRPHWGKFGLKYRMIRGDEEILPGVRLIATGGHVPGHQSVMVDLPGTGKVLLTIDAVMFASQFTRDRKPGQGDMDDALMIASTRKLLDIVERDNVALTVFGHDGGKWKALKTCPEFYD
jgi:N-acyl homoserine lactone hydrolase